MNSQITRNEVLLAKDGIKENQIRFAGKNMLALVRYTMPKFEDTEFHKNYFKILTMFAMGKIKKLIVSCPPQHGKSNGSSIYTPAMMIGRNPDLKVATVCYSSGKARKFGRGVKNLMLEKSYQEVFGTRLPSKKDTSKINTGEEMEIVGHEGSLKMVGYQGGLTGDPVDVLIMDDLYKDWKEANSPTIRQNVIDWYDTVADTRLHNDSQQLIVFTRWHEEDLVGYLERKEEVIDITDFEQLKDADPSKWYKINFQAIKESEKTPIDFRDEGQALWPARHSLKKLNKTRSRDPIKFDSLHQGNPESKEGFLYSEFRKYTDLPNNVIIRKNYTDTADAGADYLCSIDYDETSDGLAYVIDVSYTDKSMEFTEPMVANMLKRNNTRHADVESNNGGRGFARKVGDLAPSTCKVNWFHQSDNKEARIISNSATVNETVIMPHDWAERWPKFYLHVTKFKRVFKSNTHDDAPDCLTGIVETIHKPKKVARAMWL
jgi:predicted phage terminase large subunit-like protein